MSVCDACLWSVGFKQHRTQGLAQDPVLLLAVREAVWVELSYDIPQAA